MHINPSNPVSAMTGAQTQAQKRIAPKLVDSVSFAESSSLLDALNRLPDVRPAEVARARQTLVDTNHYPPRETLDQLARLLAMGLKK